MDRLPLFDCPDFLDGPSGDWAVDATGYDPTWDDEGVRVQPEPETTKTRTLTSGKLDDVIRLAHDLSDRDLELLGDAVHSMLQARMVRVQEEPEKAERRTLTNKKATQQGSFERKVVRKRGKCYGPYLYLRWWSNGVHKSTYLGKAS